MKKLNNVSEASGFTIVELMITILILGVLITIVVMTMTVSRSKAQEAACKANLRTIIEAVNQYQAIHTGELPPNLNVLVEDGYLKSSFNFECPAGDVGTISADYRTYYNATTGETSCPRPSHNP